MATFVEGSVMHITQVYIETEQVQTGKSHQNLSWFERRNVYFTKRKQKLFCGTNKDFMSLMCFSFEVDYCIPENWQNKCIEI